MLTLDKVHDPRDHLERAHRKELENFAKAHNITEIIPGMPAVVMRKILRGKGINDIGVRRTLGFTHNHVPQAQQEATQTLDATDALMAEWEGKKESPMDYTSMHIGKIKKMCKERGIKQSPSDKKIDLIRKLNGENAS